MGGLPDYKVANVHCVDHLTGHEVIWPIAGLQGGQCTLCGLLVGLQGVPMYNDWAICWNTVSRVVRHHYDLLLPSMLSPSPWPPVSNPSTPSPRSWPQAIRPAPWSPVSVTSPVMAPPGRVPDEAIWSRSKLSMASTSNATAVGVTTPRMEATNQMLFYRCRKPADFIAVEYSSTIQCFFGNDNKTEWSSRPILSLAMITDRIGQHEVILQIYYKNYNFKRMKEKKLKYKFSNLF